MSWTEATTPVRDPRDLVPWHVVRSFLPGPTALANAGRAAVEIAREVAARGELTDGLDRTEGTQGTRQLVTLTRGECLDLMASRRIGRLAFLQRQGVPLILPVNYVLDGDFLLLRSGPGPKMQAAERGDFVSFEVDDFDEQQYSGWSVVVTGRMTRVRGAERDQGVQPEPWAPGPRAHLLRIPLTRLSGRWLFASLDETVTETVTESVTVTETQPRGPDSP